MPIKEEIQAVSKVLKNRFNNLSVEELLELSFKILEELF